MDILGGDSAVVLDKQPPGMRIFAPDGSFVRTSPAPFEHLRDLVIVSRLGTGEWAGMAFGGEYPPVGTGVFRETWRIIRYAPDLTPADTLLSLGGAELYGNQARGFTNVPGGAHGHFAARGEVIVVGEADSYELKVFGVGGELRRIIRNTMPNPNESRLLTRSGSPPPRDRRGELNPPSPGAAPACDWIFVANDGTIWIRRLSGPDVETVRAIRPRSSPSASSSQIWVAEGVKGQEWHVYGTDGRLSVRALLPPRFRPTEITATRILGVWKDELGTESVRIFRLERR